MTDDNDLLYRQLLAACGPIIQGLRDIVDLAKQGRVSPLVALARVEQWEREGLAHKAFIMTARGPDFAKFYDPLLVICEKAKAEVRALIV